MRFSGVTTNIFVIFHVQEHEFWPKVHFLRSLDDLDQTVQYLVVTEVSTVTNFGNVDARLRCSITVSTMTIKQASICCIVSQVP
jgi:hypothetical protein